jgi:oligopeptidase A
MTTPNPLLHDAPLPAFPRILPEHVEDAVRQTLDSNRERIRSIEACTVPTFADVVEPLEELQHRLTKVWSPVSHLNGVMNSASLREKYNACLPLLSEYGTQIAQSTALYAAYEQILEREGPQLDDAQRAVVEHALRDFRLAGVALDAARKERFKQIMLELSRLGAKFEENVLDATNTFHLEVTDPAELAGINTTIVAQAQERAHKDGRPGWRFGLDQPTYVAILTEAQSPKLRLAYYEAWCTRASDQGPSAGRFDNTSVIEDLLRLRHEAAQLLGYPNYAAYALATRMARSVDDVLAFLRRLARAARPAAQRELAELTEFAGRKLDAWDVTYYSERLQQQRYSISQEELREYFPLPRVLEGLFSVIERLFEVKLRPRDDVGLWHPDVGYYEIFDAAGEPVGGFYLDPCARADKRSGAWMDECVGRKQTAGGKVLPVAYLVCNALPAAEGRPALLTHDDVVTLFHEFGHGLHHLLTRVAWPSVAGINGVAWDAVELPSQFLENYAWHPQVLKELSQHVVTGESLPDATIGQLMKTRSFQAGLSTLRQVEFALFDFRLHAEYDPTRADRDGARVREILAEVRREVAVIEVPSWNRYPNSFGHIFAGGYAAGYYSYKWAEVLAADAFAAFTEAGVFDRATARRYVDAILSRGGSRDAMDLFVAFRGRPSRIEPLLELHGIAA